jgi:putative membrane protein
MFHGMNGHGWGMGWWWVIGIIILIVVLWPIAQRINRNKNVPRESEKSAIDILKERYARGEINKQEFDERKKDLI